MVGYSMLQYVTSILQVCNRREACKAGIEMALDE